MSERRDGGAPDVRTPGRRSAARPSWGRAALASLARGHCPDGVSVGKGALGVPVAEGDGCSELGVGDGVGVGVV